MEFSCSIETTWNTTQTDFKTILFCSSVMEKLIGLLPANLRGDTLYSHEGLTFGSVISNSEMKTSTMLQVFEELIKYCKEKIYAEYFTNLFLIYITRFPQMKTFTFVSQRCYYYCRSPCSTISFHEKVEYSRERTKAIRKAQKNGLFVKKE